MLLLIADVFVHYPYILFDVFHMGFEDSMRMMFVDKTRFYTALFAANGAIIALQLLITAITLKRRNLSVEIKGRT